MGRARSNEVLGIGAMAAGIPGTVTQGGTFYGYCPSVRRVVSCRFWRLALTGDYWLDRDLVLDPIQPIFIAASVEPHRMKEGVNILAELLGR